VVGARVYRTEIGGRPFSIETGAVAKQANGAVLARYGDTVVLVTATGTRAPKEGFDFFPLRVDYEERQYAAGRIPGSFFRREGRPSERATLSARLIDRPIRPLFPDGFRHDVQVVATVLSYDGDNAPDITGIIGASAALCISDIPFGGPIAGVMVGLVDGQLVINPTADQLSRSALELVVAGTKDALIMVEAGADEVPEDRMLEALQFGLDEIRRICLWQEGFIAEVGREKMPWSPPAFDPALKAAVDAAASQPMRDAILNPDKQAREDAVEAVKAEVRARFPEEQAAAVNELLHEVEKRETRALILERGVRPDGRRPDEIRPIWCEVGFLPRTHGSGLFTRGQTQVCTVAALGSLSDRQLLDAIGEREDFKRYMHHYNFPPYSTGEVKPMRSPGRREIGHGALAERALVRMIPPDTEFPYTIRLVSEVLESNGSTSMASVCGSTLALMDAGVPIRRPVAGIAMGLVKEGDRVQVLSDIQGVEDHLGDMDFKVAGTEVGITALQMDLKIGGISQDVLRRALAQARQGRMFILGKMLAVLPGPRREMSPYAPRITVLTIDPDRIRDVIGPGGKTINKIIAETGADIDVEDDGKVYIAAPSGESGKRAVDWVTRLTKDPEPGEVYVGKVVRLLNFGAFVEILPGKDGLVHISELDTERVPTVEDVVSIGDQVIVKVKNIDELGRINLSRREALRTVPDARAREVIKPRPEREQPAGEGDKDRDRDGARQERARFGGDRARDGGHGGHGGHGDGRSGGRSGGERRESRVPRTE
jgi:polyribonucleotide nucleotidyltransferase